MYILISLKTVSGCIFIKKAIKTFIHSIPPPLEIFLNFRDINNAVKVTDNNNCVFFKEEKE